MSDDADRGTRPGPEGDGPAPANPADEPLPGPTSMQTTVLLCDDEAALRMLVRATLDDDQYLVVEAADGDESLARAREVRPDIVLLDMMMPGRSGLEVLRELRADPELGAVPVVVLTALARGDDREAALAAGADRYVAKPFSPLELISIVEELVARRR